MIDRVWTDVSLAARRFGRQPGPAAAIVATIGLAVGLATAVYSVASAVLLRPLPFADPDRLVAIWRTMPEVDFVPVPVPEFLDLEVPLRRGRLLGPEDRGNASVAVVNDTLARLFPERRALGQRILVARQWRDVVGVVADMTEVGQIHGSMIRQAGLSRLLLPAAYIPSGTSSGPYDVFLLVRTPLAPSEMARMVRRELLAIDPELTIRRSGTLAGRAAASGEGLRFQMLLTWIFAGVALALAAVGLYGVLAHLVGQRTREIGLRIALGATPGQVRWLIARQSMALVGPGMAIGLAGALAGGRAIGSLLFEVSPLDPPTFTAALAVMLAVASAATWLPARGATRVDPVSALRSE